MEGFIEEGREGRPPKALRSFTLKSVGLSLVPDVYTGSGLPAVSSAVLRRLAGRPGAAAGLLEQLAELKAATGDDAERFAPAFASWRDEVLPAKVDASRFPSMCGAAGAAVADLSPEDVDRGLRACDAVDALCEAAAVDALLTHFIFPLQSDGLRGRGGDERVHCSFNLSSETGRLTARRPNLQNQPALETDRYQVRFAFFIISYLIRSHILLLTALSMLYGRLEALASHV